eukprot:116705-Chlamydomonas_euryale.AAC.7
MNAARGKIRIRCARGAATAARPLTRAAATGPLAIRHADHCAVAARSAGVARRASARPRRPSCSFAAAAPSRRRCDRRVAPACFLAAACDPFALR